VSVSGEGYSTKDHTITMAKDLNPDTELVDDTVDV